MSCKFYFKVHLQRGSWNTDWCEMGLPAVRGLTWRPVVPPDVINTWSIWMWQLNFSTSMSNRCSVNPPWPPCVQDAQHHPQAELLPLHAVGICHILSFFYMETCKCFQCPLQKISGQKQALQCVHNKSHRTIHMDITWEKPIQEKILGTRMKKWILLTEFQTIYPFTFLLNSLIKSKFHIFDLPLMNNHI